VLKRWRTFLIAAMRRDRYETAMSEELRFHIDQYAADLERRGLTPDEARRRACQELGSLDNVRADCREASGLRLVDELTQNLSYSIRLLKKTPAFTATALATIAICLGANLAIFAVVDGVLLRPLPFPQAERLVKLYNTYPRADVPDDGCSLTNYYERRGHIPALQRIAIYRESATVVGDATASDREIVTRVSPEFFDTLGVPLAMGRAFSEQETTYQTDAVAILTDAEWRQRYNADPQVLGRAIRIDGLQKTIVGVLPRAFRFLSSESRVYLPLSSALEQRAANRRHWGSQAQMIGRLAPGATLEQAQAEVDAHNASVERDNPRAKAMADAGFRTPVVSLHGQHVAAVRPTLLLVQAAAVVLLCIGALNLANLLLVRAASRAKEFAVRQALGAGGRHIAVEAIIDTTLLAMLGGLLGVGVGAVGLRALTLLGADRLPLGADLGFGARVATLALASMLVLGLAASLPIAWYRLRGSSAERLQTQGRAVTGGHATQRLRHIFVVAQIALAFILLAAASLLSVSLSRVMKLSPGFQADRAISGRVLLPWGRYQDGATRMSFVDRVTSELERQPGVVAAGVVVNLPFTGHVTKSAATVVGEVPRPGEPPHGIYSYYVGGDYFSALGIALEAGRFLTPDDIHRGRRLCVVDSQFARQHWPGGRAVGQRLFQGGQIGPDEQAITVVGVVGTVKQSDLTDPAQGAVYYPYIANPDLDLYVVARTALEPVAFGSVLQRVVRSIDSTLPVGDVSAMSDRIDDTLVGRRSPAMLAGVFAAIALLLTTIGTYGVLTYIVSQRRREIGLRIALGATPRQIAVRFIRIAGQWVLCGLAIGLFGAWAAGQAMRSLLFDLPVLYGPALAGTAALLSAICVIACLIPSRRASLVSPLETLAEE
jgi:predicted permease